MLILTGTATSTSTNDVEIDIAAAGDNNWDATTTTRSQPGSAIGATAAITSAVIWSDGLYAPRATPDGRRQRHRLQQLWLYLVRSASTVCTSAQYVVVATMQQQRGHGQRAALPGNGQSTLRRAHHPLRHRLAPPFARSGIPGSSEGRRLPPPAGGPDFFSDDRKLPFSKATGTSDVQSSPVDNELPLRWFRRLHLVPAKASAPGDVRCSSHR